MGRPTLLTPETHRAIVAAIRAGSYDWIAAQANGVDRNTFMAWMRRGERERVEPYLSFRNEVQTARAQARLSAEIEVKRDQPFNWLRFGPGREREDAPGWTESKEVRHSGSLAIVQSEEWLRIANVLDQALTPFPEARLAVAQALRSLGPPDGESENETISAGAEIDGAVEPYPGAPGAALSGPTSRAEGGPTWPPGAPTLAPRANGRGALALVGGAR